MQRPADAHHLLRLRKGIHARFAADTFEHDIGALTPGQLHNPFDRVRLVHVDGVVRAVVKSLLTAFGDRVDDDDPFAQMLARRLQHQGCRPAPVP